MSETSITAKLRASIVKAAKFLETGQWPGGFWIDFELYVGMSNQWVTAYVAHCLARAVPQSPALAPAMSYLLRTELPASGWGFNRHVPPDGDSTANAVYLLARYGREFLDPSDLLRCARTLASFQSEGDGGFVTYKARQVRPGEEKPAFMYESSGWTISHLSVTGLAAVALLAFDAASAEAVFHPHRQRAAGFIRKTQEPGGYWEDHWWHDRVYGTYWAARFLATNPPTQDQDDFARLEKAKDWLAQVVHPDGAWGDGYGGAGAAFYTALAVSTLLLESICGVALVSEDRYASLARSGLECLLEMQGQDGGWPCVPMLLTPVPEVLIPWESQHPSSRQAVADQNRLFTTATALVALARGRDWLARS
jgi:squalene cyclase